MLQEPASDSRRFEVVWTVREMMTWEITRIVRLTHPCDVVDMGLDAQSYPVEGLRDILRVLRFGSTAQCDMCLPIFKFGVFVVYN